MIIYTVIPTVSYCEDGEESFYRGAVSKVNQGSAEFRIDTAADVTGMNLNTFRMLKPKQKLVRSSGPLDSPGSTLNIVG